MGDGAGRAVTGRRGAGSYPHWAGLDGAGGYGAGRQNGVLKVIDPKGRSKGKDSALHLTN